jgi:hypothetical protein
MQLKPSAPTHLGALPAMAFQQRFPPHSFFRVLATFGAGKTLQGLLEGLSEVCGGGEGGINRCPGRGIDRIIPSFHLFFYFYLFYQQHNETNAQEGQVERLAMMVWLLQQDIIEEIDLYAGTAAATT